VTDYRLPDHRGLFLTPKSAAHSVLLSAYLEKRSLLLRVISASSRDPSVAEEVVQDLFLRLSQIEVDYIIDNPTAFLLRMANNLYLNRLRMQNSRQGRDKAWHAAHHDTIDGDMVEEAPNAEAQLASRQELARLLSAVTLLPDKTQTIFRLHKLEGLSQPQVAERLDISLSSVEKHLRTALAFLTSHLHARDGP